MTRRIAFVNMKGGVGKTTTAVSLAAGLALRGHRVLLLDCDPQGSAKHSLGVTELIDRAAQAGQPVFNTLDLTLNRRPFEPIRFECPDCATATPAIAPGLCPHKKLHIPTLHFVPPTRELSLAQDSFVARIAYGGTLQLFHHLQRIHDQYDFILIDSPPTLCSLSVTAITASTEIVLPVDCKPLSFPGATDLYDLLEKLRVEAGRSDLRISGVLATMFKEGSNNPREMVDSIRTHFKDVAFDTLIHDAVDIPAATYEGLPIQLYKPKSRAAEEYNALTDELLARGTNLHSKTV